MTRDQILTGLCVAALAIVIAAGFATYVWSNLMGG